MERFAIKIDKTVKSKLKNLCRLCGIDYPDQVEILDEEEFIVVDDDDEVSLSRKIFECVGIQVTKSDRMPKRICSMCVDKINDFHEYRQMCMATNVQTRKLLNLPIEQPKKPPKKVTIKGDSKDAESIFGIVGEDSAIKTEPANKSVKKTKKSSTTVTIDESSIRSLTQQEIELALKLEETKQEVDDVDWSQNRSKSKRVKKPSAKSKATALLLAPKELNQRERKREIEQKKIEKKRKSDDVKKLPLAKKVKKEFSIDCTICGGVFASIVSRDKHIQLNHLPTIAAFSCSSCQEQFASAEENTLHHKWHQTAGVLYECVLCAASIDKMITFHRHVAACTKTLSASFIVKQNICCDICRLEFETQNLYEWHDCFIKKNAPCPKCGRVFIKKSILFKHLFKCNGSVAGTSNAVVQCPKTTTSSKKRSMKSKTDVIPSFKLEPETIIETHLTEENDEALDDGFMDTHFGDNDDDFGINDSISAPIKAQVQVHDPNLRSSGVLKQKTSTTVGKNSSSHSNVVHKLTDCVVKLEPIDISQYVANVSEPVETEEMEHMEITVTNDEIPTNTPSRVVEPIVPLPPTVPPLTIRIKKERLNPGYGDVFDPELARNIKKENADETWELVGTTQGSLVGQINSVQQSIEKKSKKSTKSNTLYRKPALLAIKIKQERFERETEVDSGENCHDYTMPVVEMQENSTPTPIIENVLPIITQIHSVLEPPTMSSIEENNQTRMLPNPFSGTQRRLLGSEITESIPFKPIRIKRERLSPPLPSPGRDSLDQIPDSTFTEPEDAILFGISERSQSSERESHTTQSITMHVELATNPEETLNPNVSMRRIVDSESDTNCSSTQNVLAYVKREPMEPTDECVEMNAPTVDTIAESTEMNTFAEAVGNSESTETANNPTPEINSSQSQFDPKDEIDAKYIDEARRKDDIGKNDRQTVSANNSASPHISSEPQNESKDTTVAEIIDEIHQQSNIDGTRNCETTATQADQRNISEIPSQLLKGNQANESTIKFVDSDNKMDPNDILLNQSAIECANASSTDQNVIQKDDEISFEAIESDLIDDESLLLDEGITEDSLLDSNPDSLLSKDVSDLNETIECEEQILEAVLSVQQIDNFNTSSLDALTDGDSNINFIDRLVDKVAEEIIGDEDNLNDLIENTTPFNSSSNGMETQPCTSSDSNNDDILGLNELIPSAEIFPEIMDAMCDENYANLGDANTQPNLEPSIDNIME